MTLKRLVITSLCLLVTATAGAAQTPGGNNDDRIWQEFLQWLRAAPQMNGPGEAIKGYQATLVGKGLPLPDAERQMGALMRLMRERSDAWPIMFDKIYASATPSFNTKPNALLMSAIEGRTPGRALDVGMGQGRNAVALAAKGWEVTGFDLSEEGLAVAKAQAARAGVGITTVHQGDEQFDFGTDRWDLIAIIYGPDATANARKVERLQQALKPGGLLVIESFASDKQAAGRRPVDLDPADLLQAFATFRIVRFEDTDAVSDWAPQPARLVRLIAQKKP